MTIKAVLKDSAIGEEVTVRGWIKTFRNNQFIALNDGSTFDNLQCVLKLEDFDEDLLKKLNCGASIEVIGLLEKSLGKGQSLEIIARKITVLGECPSESYPIQPKKHSMEFLREKAHLRVRTTTFSSVMRIRSGLAFAIHSFFNSRDFQYINTPVITGIDAEGAGEMFRVSTLNLNQLPKNEQGEIDFIQDFFGRETNLTVSGQLEAEALALGLSKVYTFGPTFRAENSNTSRHLSEFWMVEPEVAFIDINENMDLAEDMTKWVIRHVLDKYPKELAFLDQRLFQTEQQKPLNQRSEMRLIEKLKSVVEQDFERISYTEAFDILRRSNPNKKKKFKYIVDQWGCDFQSEHERFLVEKHFKKPLIVYDYPSKIKAFYMRENEDHKTVAAMDVLFPGIGEIIGGSQREERMDVLQKKIKAFNINDKSLWWYLELRKFGSVPHSGFGLGFERLVLFVTGMNNVRDVIPFPRVPQYAEF